MYTKTLLEVFFENLNFAKVQGRIDAKAYPKRAKR